MSLASYNPLLDLPTTLLLVAVAALLGLRLVVVMALPPTRASIVLPMSVALGLGVLAYATLLLGLVWLLTPLAVWLLLAVAAALSLPALPRLTSAVAQAGIELRLAMGAVRGGRLIAAGLAAIAGLNLLGSLAPPTYSDTLNHYLALSKFTVQQGGLSFEPYKWWNMPATVEMLYANLFLLFPGAVGAPIQWVYGLLTVALLFGLGLHLGGPRAALIAPSVYYAIPFVIQESTIAKNDLVLALYGLLALAGVLLYFGSSQQRWLVAAGLFAGLAMGTKLYGLLVAFGLGCALLIGLAATGTGARVHHEGTKDTKESLMGLMNTTPRALRAFVVNLRLPAVVNFRLPALYSATALAVGSPWYLKAWIQGGDPVWPFGYPIFNSRQWDMASYLKFANYELGAGADPWAFLVGPWSLTTNLAAFAGERVPAVLPIFLALLPGLALVWRGLSPPARQASAIALVGAGSYYAVWFALYQQPGYLLPAIALLSLPTALVAGALLGHARELRWISSAAVASVLAFGLLTAVAYNSQFMRVVFGLEAPGAFVASKVYYYADIEFANRSLPPDGKLLVFPTTDLYFDVPHVNGQPGFQGYVDYLSLDTETRLLERWRELDITHVFQDERYFNPGADFVRSALGGEDRLRQQFARLLANGHLEPIYENDEAVIVESRTLDRREHGRVVIYQVNYPEGPSAES